MISLLATDESYLKAEGLSLKAVKAVMPESAACTASPTACSTKFAARNPLVHEHGPISHVHEGCPPFFIVYADHDFPFCDAMSEEFGKSLQKQRTFPSRY